MTSFSGKYIAWCTAAFFFFYQYILRVTPGIIIEDLREQFKIKAEEFATLGFIYLFAYGALQIPFGIITDKYGIKKVLLFSIAACIFSTSLFFYSEHFFLLQIARFIMGAASISAFMCSLKITTDYLPEKQKAIFMGLTLAIGSIGPIFASKFIAYILSIHTWQKIGFYSNCFGIVAFLFVLVFANFPYKKNDKIINPKDKDINYISLASQLFEILKDKKVMLYSVLTIGLYTPLSALADLWGTVFLKQKFILEAADASYTSMMLYFGLGIGSILIPLFSSNNYKVIDNIILFCTFALLVGFCFILYGPNIDPQILKFTLISIGVLCGAEMLCFTAALQKSNALNSGMIIGVVNTLNMFGGAFLDQLIGCLIDMHWGGVYIDNIRFYDSSDYVFALSSIPIILIICGIIAFRLKLHKS